MPPHYPGCRHFDSPTAAILHFLARMTFPRLAAACLMIGLAPFSEAASVRFNPKRPAASQTAAYKGAIVVDALTGDVLFEDRADTVGPPASMTKLMTFAVLHDRIAAGTLTLETPVQIAPADARMGGTQVFLDPRETFPVEELIHAMMIQSANDAAHALARVAAGSVPAFIDLMNAKARELGMSNTTFRTPHGLPPASRRIAEGDLTSPRDFALLSRHLVEHTDVLKYTFIRLRPFGAGIRDEPMQMTSHNKLVGKVDGVDGLKTGFTQGAGFCLAATALRDGRRVIVVTMGSAESRTRDLTVIELLDRGFATATSAGAT
ncbi:MAG: D-alanyl-D-alanine carboxypeptidase family protein, partial [Opitutus sp.]